MNDEVRIRSTKTSKQIKARIRRQVFPKGTSSKTNRAIASAVAHSLFTDIHQGYLDKSSGNSDELGNSWPDIDPKTKAYSRKIRRGDLPSGVGRKRGILTAGLDRIWRRVYSQMMKKLTLFMDEEEAKPIAAATAWNTVKSMGARTKLEMLGNRKLPIMIDSGRLEKSLRPGTFTKNGYRKYNNDQIFRYRGTRVEIGTAVPYASKHDQKRPVFPDDLGIWFDRAADEALEAAQKVLAEMIG